MKQYTPVISPGFSKHYVMIVGRSFIGLCRVGCSDWLPLKLVPLQMPFVIPSLLYDLVEVVLYVPEARAALSSWGQLGLAEILSSSFNKEVLLVLSDPTDHK